MLYAVTLILLGVLSASGLIIQKRPDAREAIEKLAKYQGYLGVLGALWGAWVLLRSVLDLTVLYLPLGFRLTQLAIGLVLLGNGFILGYGLAMTRVKSEATKERAAEAYQKILPYQTRLGLAAIALGLFGLISPLLWR